MPDKETLRKNDDINKKKQKKKQGEDDTDSEEEKPDEKNEAFKKEETDPPGTTETSSMKDSEKGDTDEANPPPSNHDGGKKEDLKKDGGKKNPAEIKASTTTTTTTTTSANAKESKSAPASDSAGGDSSAVPDKRHHHSMAEFADDEKDGSSRSERLYSLMVTGYRGRKAAEDKELKALAEQRKIAAASTTTTTTTTTTTSSSKPQTGLSLSDSDADQDESKSSPAPSKDRVAEGIDSFNNGVGYLADAASLTSGIGSSIMGFEELAAPLEKDPSKKSDEQPKTRSELEDDHKDAKTGMSYVSLLGQGLGMLTGTLGYISNKRKAARTKSRKLRSAYRSGAFKSVMDTISSGLGFVGNGMNLWGDTKENPGLGTASSLFSWFGSIAGLAGSAANVAKEWDLSSARKNLIKDVEEKQLPNNNDANGALEGALNQQMIHAKERNPDQYEALKKRRNALKAQKYAMEQAKEFNQDKEKQMGKGYFSAIGSIGSFIGSSVKAVPGLASTGFGRVVGTLSSLIGPFKTVGKYIEKASDLNAEKRSTAKKQEIVTAYIDKKREKIKAEAASEAGNDPRYADLSSITNKEADRIAVARLGVDLPITNQDLTEKHKEDAFKEINHKRAMLIMNSDPKSKKEFLKTLMLDLDASVSDVEEALTGA